MVDWLDGTESSRCTSSVGFLSSMTPRCYSASIDHAIVDTVTSWVTSVFL